MFNPHISVIVPVYNAEQRIRQCVESVLSQTFKDFEVILVDDESRDGSLRVCREMAQRDDRIVVIQQRWGGAGAARNKGLELARGVFVAFVDADDEVRPRHLETLLQAMGDDCDIVWSNYIEVGLTGGEARCAHNLPLGVLTTTAFAQTFLDGVCGGGSLWNKLYRMDFIRTHNLRIETDRVNAEDWHFNLSLCLLGARVKMFDAATYVYRRAATSITNTYRPNDWRYKIRTYERICGISLALNRRGFDEGSLAAFMTEIIQGAKHGQDYRTIIAGLQASPACHQLLMNGSEQRVSRLGRILLHLIRGNHRASVRLYLILLAAALRIRHKILR